MPTYGALNRARSGSASAASSASTEAIAGVHRVAMEHPHGVERELVEVLAEQLQLAEQVVRDGDDVAAGAVGLDDVEDLARTSPDQLLPGPVGDRRDRRLDRGNGVDAGVRDPPGEERDA